MLPELQKILNQFSSVFFIIAFILALLFPEAATLLKPSILYLLIVLLFLGFINIDYSTLKSEIRAWKYQLYLAFLILLFAPVIYYYLTLIVTGFNPELQDFAIGILLIFGAPIAASTPAICYILNGHLERTMINMIITYLLAPITLPFLIWALLRQSVAINLLYFSVFTSTLILAPLLLALLSRKFAPKLTHKLAKTSTTVSLIVVFCIIFASGSELPHLNNHAIGIVLIAFILGLFLFIIPITLGFFLSFKKQFTDKKTTAMLMTWRNLSLSLVLADQFFGVMHPKTILFIIVSLIIWPLMIMPMRWVFNVLELKVFHHCADE